MNGWKDGFCFALFRRRCCRRRRHHRFQFHNHHAVWMMGDNNETLKEIGVGC